MPTTGPDEPARCNLAEDSPTATPTPAIDPVMLDEVERALDDVRQHQPSSGIPIAETDPPSRTRRPNSGIPGEIYAGPVSYLDSDIEPARTSADSRPEDFDG
jgi:hypothetical protein